MISIFPNGDIYPCHMFANINKPISNIMMDFDEIKKSYLRYQKEFNEWLSVKLTKCKSCNHLYLCTICPAALLENKFDKSNLDTRLNTLCKLTKSIIHEFNQK